jgi:glycosyltransferase involved in cell wall biosynthesis
MNESFTPVRIVAVMRLGNAKARDKLIPLLNSELVSHITLVRHAPVDIESEKLSQVIHNSGLVEGRTKETWRARLTNIWLCFYQGLRVAKREQPHIILSINLVPYGIIAWLVGRLTGKKVVVSLIGTDYNLRVKSPWFGRVLRPILRNLDGVTVFGEKARSDLIGYGVAPERVFVLPNTADTNLYKPNPQITPDADLIYIGNLGPLKRVDLVLQALRQMHVTRPVTTLLIVGDGAERASLETLALSLGVAHAVTFCGWTDRVVEQLWRARLMVFLSEYEGLPMALIEAMCTGLPVVATDVGAINTVVKDGENGYVVASPADPPLVAERILRLLSDAELYQQMREAALRVRGTHGYERTSRVWDEIISRLAESCGTDKR